MKGYEFELIERKTTARNQNYWTMTVVNDEGETVRATYFGNTTPTAVTKLWQNNKGYWQVEIQPHTSRDRDTGMFKGARKTAA
ncbi:MAG: hypothetical protein LUD47_07780 [Clostridia bacterium]|nr:hypothetical protein [Clostridia bacterium]